MSTSIFTITLVEVTSLETNIVLLFYAFICMLNIFSNASIYPTDKYVYVRMYVCMYVCMYVRMYACMHVCMYVCVCVYVCVYVCMYVCMYIYIYICMYVQVTQRTTQCNVMNVNQFITTACISQKR